MQAETTSVGNGRYRIHRLIGSGGLGNVFLAHDTSLNRWVAIKRLRADSETGTQRAEAVLKEARNLAALQHPNIVTIYDFVADDADTLVVMEYVAGRTLEEITAEAPLTIEDFLTIARQCLEGLSAAHARGLLHRDIKPSNVMVARQPSGALEAKILDFGLAKFAEVPLEQSTDHGGSLLGSIHTMAPEQFERRPVDARTDLYALGCVFYQCLTGKPPFDGASAAEIMAAHLQNHYAPLAGQRPDVPAALCAWVERLFAREPAGRPASARQAAGLLRAIAEGATRRVPLPEPTSSRRSRPLIAAISAATILVAGAALWALRPAKSNTLPSERPAESQAAKQQAQPPPAAKAIPASETSTLLAKTGSTQTVEGTVSRIGESRSGDVLYVNFLGNTRGDLALVQFTTPERKATDRARLEPLVGKRIQATGLITQYRGAPQIEISESSQPRLIDQP